MQAELSKDGKTIIVSIPMQLRRRGGRTTIIAPEGMEAAPKPPREDGLVKLVVRAHRWLRLLEERKFLSIRELAESEKIDASYVAKILRLTLLAPDIVEAILDNKHPDVLTWRELSRPFPVEWGEQRRLWGIPAPVQPGPH
ncbi:MAG: hypothetical protein HQM04_13760 [Magnetococcales bacterium]|nr:hypothetical protein [Magnetococcales bacterium]MBF0116089.1 hypothetical protein [Magnetococcales bacterium]